MPQKRTSPVACLFGSLADCAVQQGLSLLADLNMVLQQSLEEQGLLSDDATYHNDPIYQLDMPSFLGQQVKMLYKEDRASLEACALHLTPSQRQTLQSLL